MSMGTLLGILTLLEPSILSTTSYVSQFIVNFTLSNGLIFLLTLIVVLFIGATAEEFFFRRYILENLEEFSLKTALLLSAGIFALLHFPASVISFAFYLSMGLILGLLYVKSQYTLYPVIITHFLYNIGVILILSVV